MRDREKELNSHTFVDVKRYRTERYLGTRHPYIQSGEDYHVLKLIDKVVVKKISVLSIGKTYTARKRTSDKMVYLCTPFDIEAGLYKIDEEETNEDQLVFYIEDKILEDEESTEEVEEEI